MHDGYIFLTWPLMSPNENKHCQATKSEILGTLAAYLTRVNSKSQLESCCDLF